MIYFSRLEMSNISGHDFKVRGRMLKGGFFFLTGSDVCLEHAAGGRC